MEEEIIEINWYEDDAYEEMIIEEDDDRDEDEDIIDMTWR